jgi:predicted phosphodiesterase
MRIAVLSDVHANLPALEACLRDAADNDAEQIIVAGDHVNCGPQPTEVLDLLRDCAFPCLRGNHEDYVAAWANGQATHEQLTAKWWFPLRWTVATLSDEHKAWLASLPPTIALATSGDPELLIAHGSPRSATDSMLLGTPDADIVQMLAGLHAQVFVVGHTHMPFVRRMNGSLVVNAGSVGLPLDGSPAASYALFTRENDDWHVELRRAAYDHEAYLRDFASSSMVQQGEPAALLFFAEAALASHCFVEFLHFMGPRLDAGDSLEVIFAVFLSQRPDVRAALEAWDVM